MTEKQHVEQTSLEIKIREYAATKSEIGMARDNNKELEEEIVAEMQYRKQDMVVVDGIGVVKLQTKEKFDSANYSKEALKRLGELKNEMKEIKEAEHNRMYNSNLFEKVGKLKID